MATKSVLEKPNRHTMPASQIDTIPPQMAPGPRAFDAPNFWGPTLKEAISAPSVGEKGKQLLEWYNHSRVGRGIRRYTLKRGNLLSGGVSYTALFSIAAAVAVGWTIFILILGDNTQLREAVLDSMNKAMPGLVDTGSGSGMINPDSLVQSNAWSVTGIVGLVVLLFSASKTMTALKMSMWSMFGIVRLPDNPVIMKVRDFFGFILLAIGVLATAALGILTNAAGSWFLQILGIEGSLGKMVLKLGSLGVAFVVDTILIAILIRLVAGVRTPSLDLWIGSALAGIGSAILRFLGTTIVGSVSENPLLAASAALVTLLLWINLIVRILLMVCAWMSNPPYAELPKDKAYVHGDSTPNYVTMTETDTLDWPHHTMTGDIGFDPRFDPSSKEIILTDEVWNSDRGIWLRKRIERAERTADKHRRELWAMGEARPVGDEDAQ